MSEAPTPGERRYLWLLVPALAWGGVLAGLLLPSPSLPPGNLGCVLGSLAIAALALTREKKDIVSLCIPIFAFMIFVAPLETPPGLAIQVLYAVSLTAVAVRLERKFPAVPADRSVA
ncbi:MAG TPA: hypothetical protein VLV30_00585 [Methanomicrobiales archaeon]|nr:hypothetical protein [Methanomicrobiales archaeon]